MASLLSDDETRALVVLIEKATGIRIEPPGENMRGQSSAWFDCIMSPFGEKWARDMAEYKRKKLFGG